jgi:hypothetical protein
MTSLLLALLLFGSHGPEIHRYGVKPWTLTVSRDRFTGAVTCTAKARGARLDGDLLTFDTGRYVEIAEAVYRLDGGPALKLSALASDGDRRESFHFDPNRDGRLVFFKASDLGGVQRLYVRPDGKAGVVTFDLAALPKLLETEKGAGCPLD